jgi:hypothetical protein
MTMVGRFMAAVSGVMAVALTVGGPASAAEPAGKAIRRQSPWKVDHRYAPVWWQTSICLPDDWQKTLVGKEGTLLYDYPGKYSGFRTRIGFDYGDGAKWLRQELTSPRVPIVRTLKQAGDIEILEEAFAVAPLAPPVEEVKKKPAVVERTDRGEGNLDWAHPTVPCDPAFRDIAVAMGGTVEYRVRARAGKTYTIVLGLCEGWHAQAGNRILDLRIENKTRKTIDMVAAHGQNKPALFPFEARDENGDGWIRVAVAPAAGSPDGNTILNVLWVFEGEAPAADELLRGVSSRPALAHVNCGRDAARPGPPRHDVVLVTLRNPTDRPASLAPRLAIDSQFAVDVAAANGKATIPGGTHLTATAPIARVSQNGGKTVLELAPLELPARGQRTLAVGVLRGVEAPADGDLLPRSAEQATELKVRAANYWGGVDLPYSHFEIPDPGIQATLDSSIRNIYQAREIKDGLPSFQVGPTCYRGLWVVDGSFLLESVTFLNRADETRNGVRYLLSFQRPDGAIMLIDGHLKETGIALWAVARHARLTDDKRWLAEVWPQVEKGFDFILAMRKRASADPKAPNFGLLPEGFSDGGLGGVNPEYTNVYWTLIGMKAAADAARWLDKNDRAAAFQAHYDDFYAAFRRAAARDTRTDPRGNRYLPISMRPDMNKVSPQKAQWAFLHAVFPGKLFAADDPLVRGNMAMLGAVEAQGLVRDTGWVSNGVWNYFASFYAHGWLWLGDGQKAAKTLYAFANHASPLLVWREEQMPVGEGDANCGDMPHNWASAEFIRLVRHLLILERGDALHLFEGLPKAWLAPGKRLAVRDVLTEFGTISLQLDVAADGASAQLRVQPPRRNPPARIVLHWAGKQETLELPTGGPIERRLPLENASRR